ncbi:LacI family DNA-binding transcriptional regulator [Subtercola sp. YIM 133946]|uniref:LacI family DNA-binding transcriptional regulator n=1 Tax=Subtercola sp. YIM 133946 TaxID=3118909 RepID=UPI002F93C7F7
MPGIDAVARLAGVSAATVSRALSGNGHVSPATRLRVTEAARELGYVVSSSASSLASGRTKNIGVVVPFLNRWFYSSVLEGAGAALLRNGYDLTLYGLAGGDDERRSVFEHFLLRKRVDAVLALTIELTEREVQSLLALQKPIVGIGGPVTGVPTLSIDDVAVARLATDHLLGLGHTRIGMIGGESGFELDFHLPTNRRSGYEYALRGAGIEPDPRLFRPADFTITGGYAAARVLLEHPQTRPTAVFAASDEMALGCMLAARDLGIDVPADLSVVGIDGHEYAEFFGLTTVAQFPAQQGERAVEMLLHQLHPDRHEPAPTNIPLPVELICRRSTAPPPPRAG